MTTSGEPNYTLCALMELKYAGDAKVGPRKDPWDTMVRKCVTKLTDRDKLSIFSGKLKGQQTA